MANAVVPYYLFMPMMTAWFTTYSIARFADRKWGQRPDSTESSAAMIAAGETILVIHQALNILVAGFCIYYKSSARFAFCMALTVLACSLFEMAISLVSSLVMLLTILPRRLMRTSPAIVPKCRLDAPTGPQAPASPRATTPAPHSSQTRYGADVRPSFHDEVVVGTALKRVLDLSEPVPATRLSVALADLPNPEMGMGGLGV